jgi:hypothetical protein
MTGTTWAFLAGECPSAAPGQWHLRRHPPIPTVLHCLSSAQTGKNVQLLTVCPQCRTTCRHWIFCSLISSWKKDKKKNSMNFFTFVTF